MFNLIFSIMTVYLILFTDPSSLGVRRRFVSLFSSLSQAERFCAKFNKLCPPSSGSGYYFIESFYLI